MLISLCVKVEEKKRISRKVSQCKTFMGLCHTLSYCINVNFDFILL